MTTFYYPPMAGSVLPPGAATEATLSAINNKIANDYGPSSGAIRSASQIGNTTGQADFGAGNSSAQTVRTVIATNQSPIPVTTTPSVTDFGVTTNAARTASVLGTASGALSATNPAAAQLSDGTASYTAVKTGQIPSALGQTTMAGSVSVAIASNQSAIPVTTTPGTLDFGASAAAGRVAALIGNASGANSATNPVLTQLTDGTASYTGTKTGQLPTALGQTTMSGSVSVAIASNQSAIPVTTTPATLDFGTSTTAARTAAQIGNATGAADFNYGTPGAQTLRAAAMVGVGTAAVGQTNPVPSRLSDGTDYVSTVAIAASQTTVSTATKTLETTAFNLGWDGTTHRELSVDTTGATTIVYKTLGFGASATAGRVAAVLGNAAGTLSYDVGASDAGTIRIIQAGRTYADSARLDFSSTNVTTGAWVQLIASTAAAATQIYIFCGTGECLELGTGAAASETRILLIPPGGIDGIIAATIPASTRVAVRAVSATASTGSLVLNLRS